MNYQNLVLIILDTLRGDKVCTKYKDIFLTPYIKKILKSSIYFKNCIANSPWTLPSHISMFTGLYYSQVKFLSKKANYISINLPILTEILNEMGYFTICFTENPNISKVFGLTRGFEKILNYWSTPWALLRKKNKFSIFEIILFKINIFFRKRIKSKLFLKIWDFFRLRVEIVLNLIKTILFWKDILFNYNTLNSLEKLDNLLKKNTNNKPLYLFFNIMATHPPYIPTINILNHFGIKMRDLKKVKKFLLNPGKYNVKINFKSQNLSRKKIEILIELYNACVFYADLIVKHIFKILANKGYLEKSYVLITSDHGEHLFNKLDHNLWGHFNNISVYDSLLRVPLIIFNNNFKKKKIEYQVELKDLYHTILQLTGISEARNKHMRINKSLLIQLKTNNYPKYIFGEHIKDNLRLYDLKLQISKHQKKLKKENIIKFNNDIFFLRSNEYKYMKFDNKIGELYNLIDDPNEQVNIYKKNNEIFKKLYFKLEKKIDKLCDLEELNRIRTEKEKDIIKKWIKGLKFL